jgi:ActR/RegA family two-component response regulator
METSAPARVLVVVDDDEIRALRLMSRVLGSSTIACRTAGSAADRLRQVRTILGSRSQS